LLFDGKEGKKFGVKSCLKIKVLSKAAAHRERGRAERKCAPRFWFVALFSTKEKVGPTTEHLMLHKRSGAYLYNKSI